MRMFTSGFNQLSELNKYVNEKGIEKDQIVSILQDKNGTWMLVYYEA